MPFDVIIGRDPADKERFGNRGLVNIGKGYVRMGNFTSLSNKIWMDVARSHVILVAGKRGSGKSYSLGVIAEEIGNLPKEAARNIASLIFDTMGIFWTMKYKNEKDSLLLKEWDLEPKQVPVKIFVPFGKAQDYKKKEIPFDETFALKASELDAEDWITLFNLNFTSLEGVLIERAIAALSQSGKSFTLEEIQHFVEHDTIAEKATKQIVYALFKAASTWGIFSESEEGTEISDLVTAGTTTILDTSVYSSIGAFNVRALVISLVSRKLFQTRMDARKKEETEAIRHGQEYLSYKTARSEPLVWIFIDECLTGDTEIVTSKNHTSMQEVIRKFEGGNKLDVLAYDKEKKEFGHYPIEKVYKKGKRKVIEITT